MTLNTEMTSGDVMTERPEADLNLSKLHDQLTELGEQQTQFGTHVEGFNARLSLLGGDVTELRDELSQASDGLQSVRRDVAGLEDQVTRTRQALDTFIEQYGRDREVTKAQAELTRLTTEWHAVFDQRRQTRALARGLVHTLTAQAVRRNVVNTATVRACAEERMLLEPAFWLAPAAMAAAARFQSDIERVERARAHAQALDAAKANLFFSLTCSRLGDEKEAAAWMDRYLQSLDPDELGQDFLVVLDAIASNELGDEALSYARQTMARWNSGAVGARDALHRENWEDRLWNLARSVQQDRFGALRTMCGEQWPALQQGWEMATVPAGALDYLCEQYPDGAGATDGPADGQYVLHALERLINQLEPDEASMRDAMQWQERIVEHGGDIEAARKAYLPLNAADGAPVTISALLDRAVFEPDEVQLGGAARGMALRAIWPSLEGCVRQFVVRSSRRLPDDIPLEIEGWMCTVPTDPRAPVESTPLVKQLSEHIESRAQAKSDAVVRRWPHVCAAVVGGALFGALIVPFVEGPWQQFFGLLTALTVLWVIWELCRVPLQKRFLRDEAVRQRAHAVSVLDQALSERAVFFAEWHAGMASLSPFTEWGEPGRGQG
ncbi:hypothetical protein ACFCYI_12010 [Streptomyces sp. NPDC056257]|uniref:hypothetical protein n=1 Tax=Streptomyces sp. NPDC056257 TaxID=3345765 RepID=UPI0035DF66F3